MKSFYPGNQNVKGDDTEVNWLIDSLMICDAHCWPSRNKTNFLAKLKIIYNFTQDSCLYRVTFHWVANQN